MKVSPVIDGKLDDTAWVEAAVIPEFRKYGTGVVPEKGTVVRMGYDARNLYIAFKCSQPASGAIRAIVNQEAVDAPVFTDDCLELLFATSEKSQAYHLAATTRGVRWDAFDEKPELWDGRWEVATTRGPDAWIAEFKIPFAELPQDGTPQGTPAVKATWWMNFARNAPENSEWSQWSPSKKGGFADRSCFRPVSFGPRPQPWDIDVKITNQGLLSVGTSELLVEASKRNVSPIEFSCSLSRKTTEGWIAKNIFLHRPQNDGGSLKLKIPYRITQGGEYRLELETKSPNVLTPLNVWSTAFEVVDLGGPLKRLTEKSGHCRQLFSKINDSTVRQDCENILKNLEKEKESIQSDVSNENKMTAKLWEDLQKKAVESVETADKLERQLQKQAWKEEIAVASPDAEFCVGITTPFEQVFREDLFVGPINQPLRIQSARNEMEDAQIVVVPLGNKDLSDVTFEISEMKLDKGEAVLPASQWWIGAVGYIERPRPANSRGDFRAFWPDVFLPAAPVKVDAGKQQPVFMRVTVPEKQVAGLYRGTLTIRSKTTTETLPVELDVWDFTLPRNASLQTETWFVFRSLCKYYNIKEVTLAQYENILRDFQGYRMSIYPFDWEFMFRKFKLSREKDGSLGVDFSDFDPYFDLAISYGANVININLAGSALEGLFSGASPWLKITDRETGKVSPFPAKPYPRSEAYENPDFISFWEQYWKHAQIKGWGKVAYMEEVDEPNSGDRQAWLIRTHSFFRKHCPGLPLQSFDAFPSKIPKAIGLIDIWAPQLSRYGVDADVYPERQKKYGEKVWVYTCGSPAKNLKGYSPDTLTDTPLLDKRIVPLMCWKFNIQGLFQFTFDHFDCHDDLLNKGAEKKWGQYPIMHAAPSKSGFGVSNLTWPGPQLCQLLPSLRLEMKRDGLEDYEYMVVLQGLFEKLKRGDSPQSKALVDETIQYLQIPNDLVTDAYSWSHNPGKLLDWRTQIAKQILKLQKSLNEKSVMQKTENRHK
ncbi:MAG: glycoside hydrolase domain-containing protein [Phycisphaerae bacterium]|jgi:hypothetical protein